MVLDELDLPFVAWSFSIYWDHWFHKISLPKQKFSVLRRAQHISVLELCVRSNVWKLKLTKLSNISLQFQPSEGLRDFPESDVASTTCCQPIFVELAERNPVNFLTECLWLEQQPLLFPVPHSQKIIRVWAHRSKQFSASRKVNRRVRPFSALPENPIKLQRRILIDVDIGNWPHFSHSKIFLRRMHSQRSNSSTIFGVKLFLILGEMVENGIRDTRCKDDGVAIQH